MNRGFDMRISISVLMFGGWVWCGYGVFNGYRIEDCPAALDDDVFEALEESLQVYSHTGGEKVMVNGELYKWDRQGGAKPYRPLSIRSPKEYEQVSKESRANGDGHRWARIGRYTHAYRLLVMWVYEWES